MREEENGTAKLADRSIAPHRNLVTEAGSGLRRWLLSLSGSLSCWGLRVPFSLGSFELAPFGLVIWLMIVQSPASALVLAAASRLAVAVLGWQVRRWL